MTPVDALEEVYSFLGAQGNSVIIHSKGFTTKMESMLQKTLTAGVKAWTIVQALNKVGKVVIIGGAIRDVMRPKAGAESMPKDIDGQ